LRGDKREKLDLNWIEIGDCFLSCDGQLSRVIAKWFQPLFDFSRTFWGDGNDAKVRRVPAPSTDQTSAMYQVQ